MTAGLSVYKLLEHCLPGINDGLVGLLGMLGRGVKKGCIGNKCQDLDRRWRHAGHDNLSTCIVCRALCRVVLALLEVLVDY